MKCGQSTKTIHKEVVIIGNGPSGISLSYMLAGNTAHLTSTQHPDELLAARLAHHATEGALVHQDMGYLAHGLDGRTTNPISLLFDALAHPYADVGFDLAPLVEWAKTEPEDIVMHSCRKLVENVVFFRNLPLTLLVKIVACLKFEVFLQNDVITRANTQGDSMFFIATGTVAVYTQTGVEIDHVVLGKGPPGGSWHTMDPHILTLSLGAWMALPGLPFPANADDDDTTTRASASQVAAYYQNYVTQMGLQSHFHNNVIVTRIQAINTDDNNNNNKQTSNHNNNTTALSRTNTNTTTKTCTHNNSKHSHWLQRFKLEKCQQFNSLLLPPPRRIITKCLRFYRITDENVEPMECNINIYRMLLCDRKKNLTSSENNNNNNDGKLQDHNLNKTNQLSPFRRCKQIQCDKYCEKTNSRTNSQPKWIVETYNKLTRDTVSYTCNSLVLANGANDLPNRLALKGEREEMSVEPVWLVHDVRSLEIELDLYKSVSDRKDNGMSGMDPVLIVGAGLSAADAIIATRKRNIPVLHVFRSKSSDLIRKLPENMYPEYHKIHEMMLNTTTIYPNYTALPEHTIDTISDTTHSVTLTHKPSVTTVNSCHPSQYTYRVSFAAVLIGSRPDLSFLPPHYNLASSTSDKINNSLTTSDKINNSLPVNDKLNNSNRLSTTSDKTNNNILRIDKVTHGVVGYEGLYALGPLAGDKFVRFIPGGALAVMSDLYKKGIHLQRVG